jgi:hypothetical protein
LWSELHGQGLQLCLLLLLTRHGHGVLEMNWMIAHAHAMQLQQTSWLLLLHTQLQRWCWHCT